MIKLFGMLIPRGHIGNGLSRENASVLFDDYAEKMKRHIAGVYGDVSVNKKELGYSFQGTVEFEYNFSSLAQGSSGIGIYTAFIKSDQDLEETLLGQFLNTAYEDFLIPCKDGGTNFQIYDNKTEERGIDLLKKLNAVPEEGCVYRVVPGAIGWDWVKLEQ